MLLILWCCVSDSTAEEIPRASTLVGEATAKLGECPILD